MECHFIKINILKSAGGRRASPPRAWYELNSRVQLRLECCDVNMSPSTAGSIRDRYLASVSTANNESWNNENIPNSSKPRSLGYRSSVVGTKPSEISIPGITDEDVTGLHGRKRLARDESVTATVASKNWMDKQRKNLQAYEYLCHIGEAKE